MARSALLVIDVQNIYTDRKSDMFCKDSVATVERINRLIERFSAKNLPIVYVRHQHSKDGSDIGHLFDFAGEREEQFNFVQGTKEVEYDPRLSRPHSTIEVIKTRYSAFKNTALDKILKDAKVERVVICGFMTNFCCESTAREALDSDYYVDFIRDATGTPGTDDLDEKQIRKVVAQILSAGFARIFDTKEYIKSEL